MGGQRAKSREGDMVGYSSGNCTAAVEWERTIYDFLDGHGIKSGGILN